MIPEHVWDINFDTFTNVIDVYISYLRNKTIVVMKQNSSIRYGAEGMS